MQGDRAVSLYQIRRQVDALKRRLPVHYKLALLRPYAEQFCDDWEYCVGMGYEPPPFDSRYAITAYPPTKSRAEPFMDRVRDAGINSRTWMDVKKYLVNCRNERIYPHPDEILKIALPRAASLHLLPPSPNPISYPMLTTEHPKIDQGRSD